MKKQMGFSFHRGFTIIEVLVALLIGLLSVYAVYNVYQHYEQINRSTSSLGNLQMSGLQSLFLLEQAINDAGSGMMRASYVQADGFDKLISCNDPLPTQTDSLDNILALVTSSGVASESALTLRPLPVVINPATSALTQNPLNEIYVYSGAPTSIYGVLRNNDGEDYLEPLKSGQETDFSDLPFTFKKEDVLIAVENAGKCTPFEVTDSRTETSKDTSGAEVTSRFATLKSGASTTVANPIAIVYLGKVTRYRFWVDTKTSAASTGKHNILYMDEYTFNATSGKWEMSNSTSVVENVQYLVAQYGVDNDDDDIVDHWVNAQKNTTSGEDWSPIALRLAGLTGGARKADDLKRIKAIRVGLIAQTDDPDRETATHMSAGTHTIQLFPAVDCPLTDKNNCEAVSAFTYRAGEGPNETTYRYRKYETIIPIRNVVWNSPRSVFNED